ncbi:MAG TPA: ABC transporter permease [Solirubrobacteraceae bacterium]|jgi:osmoprotectant transport system permease protein|nr:ABC transporter permease [Solirubrobacteraceae bacterium]
MNPAFAVNLPKFGNPNQFACERANRLFCWGWFRQNWGSTLWPALRQHVVLVLIAVVIGFAISMTLALIAYRYRHAEQPLIWFTSFLYTIPSLALFELLVPVPGLGLSRTTAEVALVAYTLLILFRNILTGLRNVPVDVRDAARGMGMSDRQMLLRVDLPLALPAIIAGLRIATVSTIALATLAVEVDGNQGLGAPILSAINDNYFKTELIAAGALAVLLAFAADALLVGAQRLLTPWARTRIA